MKIVISTYTFLPERGGVSTNVSILASAFVQAGHNVVVVTTTSGQVGDYGYQVVRKPTPWTLFYLYATADILILSNLSIRLLYPLLVLRRKFALRHHSESAFHLSKGLLTPDILRRLVLPNARHFMTSDFVGRKSGFARYVVTSPFANPTHIDPAASRSVGKREGVVFAGRLEPEKGLHFILNHWPQTKDILGVDELRILGDGSLRSEIERRIGTGQLEGVRYLGAADLAGVAQELSQAAYVLVPSLWDEPFGAAALEAVAAGALVILTDRGGLPEAAGDLGFYFNPDEPQSFTNALAAAKEVRSQQLVSGEIRQLYEQRVLAHVAKFQPEKVVDAIVSEFDDSRHEHRPSGQNRATKSANSASV